MNKFIVSLLGLLAITILSVPPATGADNHSSAVQLENESSNSNATIERTLTSRGTQYNLTINTSNHTVRVKTNHFSNNDTFAGYVVHLNGYPVINKNWRATHGEEKLSSANLIYKYKATNKIRNLSLSTYGDQVSISYNFTVPIEYEGQYLRPTITDVEFDRLNDSFGRVTVTIQSDSVYTYPVYYQFWTDGIQAEYLNVQWKKDKNITTASTIIPLSRGEPFSGEIRAHSGWLNETGPLHSQVKFYGYPGDAEFTRVPYEPMQLERVSEYTYVNESNSVDDRVGGVSDGLFRRALGVAGGALLLIVVVGVVLGRRSRV